VLRSINLDHKAVLNTDEIYDVVTHLVLTPEVLAGDLVVSQVSPKDVFRFSRTFSQATSN
jgi:hypothetical protein